MVCAFGSSGDLDNKGGVLNDFKSRYSCGPKDRQYVAGETNDSLDKDGYYDECLSGVLCGLEGAGYRIVDHVGASMFLADHGGDPILLLVVLASADTMSGLLGAGHSVDEVLEELMDDQGFANACAAGLLSVMMGHHEVPFEKVRVDAVLSYERSEGADKKVVVVHRLGMAYGGDLIKTFGDAFASGSGL